jgi:hypothetical protein
MRCHGLGVFLFTDSAQRFCTHLKVRNESGVELGEADEFRNVADKFRLVPILAGAEFYVLLHFKTLLVSKNILP